MEATGTAKATNSSGTANVTNMVRIPFTVQDIGYDTKQVDKYIQKLTDEYAKLQRGYQELSTRYNDLVNRPAAGMDAISKALVDAEIKAGSVIDDANNKAALVVGNAQMELGRIKQEKERTIIEINELINGLKEVFTNNTQPKPERPDGLGAMRWE